jgi:hypothetical protein
MSELGLVEYFSMAEALGIIATLFVITYFSRKQMQSLSVDIQTKVLNDLDEKFHKMAELAMEDPSIQKVIDNQVKPSRELAFSYYILWICSHAHAMRRRNILDDNEWEGWLQWMRNSFRKGTIRETWKQVESERWFNPAFQNFITNEIIPKS